MWRYLPPAVLVVAAVVVLFAGAAGDMQSWATSYDLSQWSTQAGPLPALHNLWQAALARVVPAPAVSRVPPPALSGTPIQAPPAAPNPDGTDTLRRQLSTLEAQVVQQKQQIASLTATVDAARQAADALRQQRQAEAAVAPPHNPPAAAMAPKPPPSPPALHQMRAPPRPATEAWIAVPTQQGVAPKERLQAAREALLAGRNEEARSLMETAQLQFVFSPIDPDAPAGDNISMPATWIGRALKSLQLGDASGALHDLDLAMNSS